jgi:DNA-binding SARP family transcriptional activator
MTCTAATLALAPEMRLDVAALEEHGWALLDSSTGIPVNLRSDLFSQELLPGWYEDWVMVERDRLGQLQIRFLEAFVHCMRERQEFTRAIDQAMRLVALDPLRERSQLALIRALVDEGSWGRAQWQAGQYCLLLDDSFGCDASAAFMSKYRQLLPFEHVLAR